MAHVTCSCAGDNLRNDRRKAERQILSLEAERRHDPCRDGLLNRVHAKGLGVQCLPKWASDNSWKYSSEDHGGSRLELQIRQKSCRVQKRSLEQSLSQIGKQLQGFKSLYPPLITKDPLSLALA